MGHKAAERTHNKDTSGPGTLTKVQYSGDSRSSAKETRALKMRSVVAGH